MRFIHFALTIAITSRGFGTQFAFASSLDDEQIRIMPVDDSFPTSQTGPLLADMLTLENSLSIFYSYARETRFSELLMREDSRITVLAPTNKAVMALARKPYVPPTLFIPQGLIDIRNSVIKDQNLSRKVSL